VKKYLLSIVLAFGLSASAVAADYPGGGVRATGDWSQLGAEGDGDGGIMCRHVASWTQTIMERECYFLTGALLNPTKPVPVTFSSGVVTWVGHGGGDGSVVIFKPATTANGSMIPGMFYYMRDTTSTTFRLTHRPGGDPVPWTTDPTGTIEAYTGSEIKTSSASVHICDFGAKTWWNIMRLSATYHNGSTPMDDLQIRYGGGKGVLIGRTDTADCNSLPGAGAVRIQTTLNSAAGWIRVRNSNGHSAIKFERDNYNAAGYVGQCKGMGLCTNDDDFMLFGEGASDRKLYLCEAGGTRCQTLGRIMQRLQALDGAPF